MKHRRPAVIRPVIRTEQMENGNWFAHIPAFRGLWGQGENEIAAVEDLLSATPGWLRLEYCRYLHSTAGVVAKGRRGG